MPLQLKQNNSMGLNPTGDIFGGMYPSTPSFTPDYSLDISNFTNGSGIGFNAGGNSLYSGASGVAGAAKAPGTWDSMNLFGGVKDGVRDLGKFDYGLAAGSALMNAFMGMKQYGLAKKQFGLQKEFANKNYEASRTDYNNRMDGRAREMAAANPNFQDNYKRI